MKVNNTNAPATLGAFFKIPKTQEGRTNLNVLKAFLQASGEDMNKVNVQEVNNPSLYLLSTPSPEQDEFFNRMGKIITKSSVSEFYQEKIALLQEFVNRAKPFEEKQAETLKGLTKNYLEEL